MITVPKAFADDTITREGDAGRQWLAELPRRVAALCVQWRLAIDGPVMHGYVGLAVPVHRGDEPCVLKLSWIDDFSKDEPIALQAWNGDGAVRLLEWEPTSGAMLLERLDFRCSLNDVPVTEAVTIAGRLLHRLAIPAPAGLRTMRDVYANVNELLPRRWAQYGRPMSRQWLERACGLAAALGQSDQRLLANYDLHYLNILAAEREPWLVLDPKVAAGVPEFGLAQLLWCRLDEMEAEGGLARHFDLLVEAAELDAQLARGWTFVRCVDYWLWGLTVGLTYDPGRCQRIIAWLSA